jgi:hypothetical protein
MIYGIVQFLGCFAIRAMVLHLPDSIAHPVPPMSTPRYDALPRVERTGLADHVCGVHYAKHVRVGSFSLFKIKFVLIW